MNGGGKRKAMTKQKIKLFFSYLTGIMICFSACGKQAEDVTNYGEQNSANIFSSEKGDPNTSTDETEGESHTDTSERIEIKDASTGHKLSDWLGGKDLTWKSNFAVGSVPVEANFTVGIAESVEDFDKQYQKEPASIVLWDTYELPAWKVSGISRDNVNEEKIVKNLFGDSARKVERHLSLEYGDAKGIIEACHRCKMMTDLPQNPGNENYSSDSQEVSAQADGEDYYWHTYEGTYLGLNYQLTIGYLGSDHKKVLAFYPKKLGDVVEAAQISNVVSAKNHQLIISQEDEFYVKDLDELSVAKNRTTKNEESIRKEAEDFLRDQLLCSLYHGEVITHFNDERPTDLVFITEEDVWDEFPDDGVMSENLYGAVVDGYLVNLDTSIGKQRFPADSAADANNDGRLWITEKGVIGGTLYISYDYEECLTEQIAILPFEQVTGSMELIITENLDISKVKGQALKLDDLEFIYYAYPYPNDPQKFTLIPVWKVSVVSDQTIICTVIMNAVSGSLIEIKYV